MKLSSSAALEIIKMITSSVKFRQNDDIFVSVFWFRRTVALKNAIVIRTLHYCPSQMNESLLISKQQFDFICEGQSRWVCII